MFCLGLVWFASAGVVGTRTVYRGNVGVRLRRTPKGKRFGLWDAVATLMAEGAVGVPLGVEFGFMWGDGTIAANNNIGPPDEIFPKMPAGSMAWAETDLVRKGYVP